MADTKDDDDKEKGVVIEQPKSLTKKWEEGAEQARKTRKERFGRLKDFFRGYWERKKWTIPVTVLVLIIIPFLVPQSRYPLAGLVIKNKTVVMVLDSKTAKPVTGVEVSLGDQNSKTDNKGVVVLETKPGKAVLAAKKNYFKSKSQELFVPMFAKKTVQIKVVATGRQVPIVVTDHISGKPLANVQIKAAGTEVKTDAKGKATLVLPTNKDVQKATFVLAGYNDKSADVTVVERQINSNKFTLTANGKVYFLSNRSGKIDVVKSNLDGTERETILEGTGSEESTNTSLLASRDWKYLALLAKREGGKTSMYLIDTSTDKVTNIDGGSPTTSFTLVGWSDDTFIYQTIRSDIQAWQPNAQVLKAYDANAGKLFNIDQTQGEGTDSTSYANTTFSGIYILNNEVVYAKNAYATADRSSGKNASLISVKPDGSGRRVVKDFPVPDGTYGLYVGLSLYEPYGMYVQVPTGTGPYNYYKYEDGQLEQKADVTDEIFSKPYPTFLISPSERQTFWSELRDGKNTLFVGGSEAQAPRQIANLNEYTPYGWFSDNYLLVSRNGSELSIMPTDGSKGPTKLTDYYKPQLTYRNYGGGYGGL